MTIGGLRLRSMAMVGFLVVAAGCTGDEGRTPDTRPTDPESTFDRLERELLNGEGIELEYSITSEGAIESSLSGTLTIAPGNVLDLYATGMFGGDTVDAAIRSNGETMRVVAGRDSSESPTPTHLTEGVVIGLTRMGLLHNLARLTGAAPPDRTDGSVQEWVTVTDFTSPMYETEQRATPVGFQLVVAGEPAGEATLWIDESVWLPLLRIQTVRFPQGEMQVTETYSW